MLHFKMVMSQEPRGQGVDGEDPKVTYFGVKLTRGGWPPLMINLTNNLDSPGRWDLGQACGDYLDGVN